MADMSYVTFKTLTQKPRIYEKKNHQAILVLLCGCIALALAFIDFTLAVIVIFSLFMVWVLQRMDKIDVTDTVDENTALQQLSQLPDGFTIFNQVNIPEADFNTDVHQADIVVYGPNTVFVIALFSQYNNPIAHVKQLVWLLSTEMTRKKSQYWIQGVVVCANEYAKATLDQNSKIPVLGIYELVNYILACNASQARSNRSRTGFCADSSKVPSV